MTSADALAEHAALVRRVEDLLPLVDRAARLIVGAYEGDGRVLAFGNGGSAADAQHLAAELVGRFDRPRRPLAAISLATDPSVVTCVANDFSSMSTTSFTAICKSPQADRRRKWRRMTTHGCARFVRRLCCSFAIRR